MTLESLIGFFIDPSFSNKGTPVQDTEAGRYRELNKLIKSGEGQKKDKDRKRKVTTRQMRLNSTK